MRALARATNISKSSVHRISQRIEHRHQHPESYFWETAEGYQWLRLLVFATIYIFGIKQGIGSEVLSEFFHLLRLNKQIGVSPTALRRLEAQMRSLILTYEQEQHQQIELTSTQVEIIAGADETFFPGIVLVLMDLVSGYILLEEKTSDRTGVESYHHILHQISLIVHPFAVDGSGFQTTVDVAKALREQLPILAALGQTYQLSKIKKALEQFSHQILGIAAGINFWWQSIEQSLLLEEVDLVTENWLLGSLLPEVYWLSQRTESKNREQNRSEAADITVTVSQKIKVIVVIRAQQSY